MIIIIKKAVFKMEIISKHSKQREAILALLRETKTHPTAEWLHSNLKESYPKLGLATVYRNLRLFEQLGLVQRIDVGDGLEHFDAGVHTHYHFYCRNCNSVIDVDLPNLHPEQYLPDGFTPHRHQLVFYGECSNCKSKNQKIN